MWDRSRFLKFLNVLAVDTKELGRIYLGQSLRGTQRRFIDEVSAGLDEGYHEFQVLKCRQIGLSTIGLGFDMFFAFNTEGAEGAIITHDEPSRDKFRSTLTTYYDNLPPEWTQEQVAHNRNQWVLGNRTSFLYRVAGTKEKSAGTLGRSAALIFAHSTEVAFWGDAGQVNSLQDCFAEINPNRFYLWESTANGFNHYERMWRDAQNSTTVKPIFITWWSDEFARVGRDTTRYKEYWGHKGRPTPYERDLCKQVAEYYGVEIDDEQLAWYRWCLAEKKHGDEDARRQEFPSTPDEAFVASGSNFFSPEKMTDAYKRVLHQKRPLNFKFQLGDEFHETRVMECNDRQAMLRIWEQPVEGGWYTIGGDPAYGSSEEADRYVLSVNRCWSNRVVQVAEFCVTELNTRQFAWIIAYLAGCYQPCVWNLELNGPGGAVLQEVDNVRRLVGRGYYSSISPDITNAVRKIQDFYYARPDSMRGRPIGKHTVTTSRIKESYLSMMRGAFEAGQFVPNSWWLLEEMRSFVRDAGWLGASGDKKDDRVIASALAYMAYNDSMRAQLIMRRIDWSEEAEQRKDEKQNPRDEVVSRLVQNFMHNAGFKRESHNPAGVKSYNLSKYGVKRLNNGRNQGIPLRRS